MIESDERPLTGGCQCGAVRYEISAEPLNLYACHCGECRKQSGSSFGMSLIVPRAAFKLTAGEPKCWSRPSAQGSNVDCWFCPECGSRLYHASSSWPDELSVKAGTVDQPVEAAAAIHIWTAYGLPSTPIPMGATTFPFEPDS